MYDGYLQIHYLKLYNTFGIYYIILNCVSYLSVVVLTDIIVETSLLICVKLGFWICNLSEAILFNAVLSRTTTQSAHCVNLLRVNKEL